MNLDKPNCYECKWRRDIPGDAHSECVNPAVGEHGILALARLVCMGENVMGVRGNQHGIKNGWFCWPINFDPVWLESCDGFSEKGGDEIEALKT